jgi:ribonuclease-3 family protein
MAPDFLHPNLDTTALNRMSTLGLAHIGDGVYELMTRSYLICSGLHTARTLHSKTVSLVRASAQYQASQQILPLLTEEEHAVFRRGRNVNVHRVPQGASQAEYAYATALECLFGWLYLQQRYERLNELYAVLSADFPRLLEKA